MEWSEEVQNKHMEMQRACVGCFYQRATFGNGTDRDLANFSCDYILITGKKRPCKPGKDCTVRLEKTMGGQDHHG